MLLGYRLPGYDSPDYAAAQILGDVLSSQRSAFGAMPYTGKRSRRSSSYRRIRKPASASRSAAVPVTTQPETVDDRVCERSSPDTAEDGVPPDLVAAAKLREISQLEFNANSIEGMAAEWSQAVAVQELAFARTT